MHRISRTLAAASALTLGMALVPPLVTGAQAAAPVGQGFNLNASDLRFIMKQIKISEAHAASATPDNPCGTLLNAGPSDPALNQIDNQNGQGVLLPFGLRTLDGTCNNLLPGKVRLGAADNVFPRIATPEFRAAETGDPDGPTGPAQPAPTSYVQNTGAVFDSQPRLASNLIVDQTPGNPAAVAAAGANAVPDASGTLSIPNVAPDVGLSAPFNSWFTLFGQFFDHGLDLTNKGGSGSVFVPLKADDPLIASAGRTPFMVLTRSTNQPGLDGIRGTADDIKEATNQTSTFVDQSQTYSSHPSHQVFLRQYALNAALDPVSTGKLVTGADGGLATWASVKAQAKTLLGIALVDTDIGNIPLLATDQYGKFTPGVNGYPQMKMADGTLLEGDPAANGGAGVAVPLTALRTNHAFLDDIAHHAVPVGGRPAAALTPDVDSGTSDDGDPTTYDDEMLNAHFLAGDGRLNENIGLSAVHQVFHSEHNRLNDDIKNVLTTQDPTQVAQWQAADGSWNGERLFQAAKFVTEMEYQHLAFEEFARKVQPQVNLFAGYDASVNPAITAEFAHSVYRFGHSMLTETVARTKPSGAKDDIALLDAFLNPPSYTKGGTLTPEQAAGDIVRGMTDQVGQEIDEFVTDALRNRLLGLPLDLAALNMARGREAGIQRLNESRRQFSAATNGNPALAPYANWLNFGLEIKHPTSMINFVAAYGTHPSITGAATAAAKRTAAQLLVAGDPLNTATPADSADFMNGTGAWVNVGGRTTTGLDDVDLWVGGLAEKQSPFGGLLGSTFNYVFETQMENLQDGDRFYYLSRTAGLNMLVQLEGNSFSELIMRNTDVTTLPADSFSRLDLKFDLGVQASSGPIVDDPATEYDERTLLTRMADGTVRYAGPLHVLFTGSPGGDRARSSEGDDTMRGQDGDDVLEGGAGNDSFIGGLGQDILTDLFGDDVLKGGDGHDALSSGAGFDLNQPGRGDDFVVGGSDPTETFGGAGNDKIFGGDSTDTLFGDDGDDWLEGGGQADLVQGDNGAPFQDDPNTPGHDVLNGNGGNDDYDAEGGDDIMVAGPGTERNEGILGFDWVTNKNNPVAADDDLQLTGLLPPTVGNLRDRFDLVEGLSGYNSNDTLRGDNGDAITMGTAHALDAAGIARITGLAGLLPAGATSFNAGNILTGGAGNDLIEGRGGNDVIDGDAWLDVQLRAPNPATPSTTDTQLVDGMTSLQADVFAGRINPGDISIVRSIVTAPADAAVDTAVFTGPRSSYTVAHNATTGVTTVTQNVLATGQRVSDGVDTLRRVEALRFSNQTLLTKVPNAPANVVATAGASTTSATAGSAGVTWTAPVVDAGESARTSYQVVATPTNGGTVVTRTGLSAASTSGTVNGLVIGVPYTLQVRAVNLFGTGPLSAPSNAVTPTGLPGVPRTVVVTRGDASLTVTWAAPLSDGGSPITGYEVLVRRGAVAEPVGPPVVITVVGTTASITGLTNGVAYNVQIRAVNALGRGAAATSGTVTPATVPDAPVLGAVTSGAAGGTRTVVANWTPPLFNGGVAVLDYSVTAYNPDGTVSQRITVGSTTRARTFTLPVVGPYTFDVRARNAVGDGAFSTRSAPTDAL